MWNLTASCLWFDEIFSVHAAKNSWDIFFGFLAQDLIHPPLFYIALKFWIMIGGESLLWLRLFSVVVAALALYPLAMLGRELKFNHFETAGLILLFAVNGSLIKYAQEVRMYSLLFCLTAFSVWLFVRWIKHENASIVWLVLVNLLLIYTHYFGWLVVGTEVIAALWLSSKRKQFIAPILIWIASFVPWVYAVYSAYTHSGAQQNLNWAERPGLRTLAHFIATLHQFFYFQQSGLDAPFSWLAVPVILVCIASIVCLFMFYRDERTEIKTLMLLATAPLVIAFFVSLVSPFSIWGVRHLIVIFAPYFVLAVMGFRYIKPTVVRHVCAGALALIFALTFSLYLVRKQTVFSWCGWEVLAEQVKGTEINKVYAFEDFIAYETWFLLEQRAAGKFQVTLIEDNADIREDKAYFLPRGFDGVRTANMSDISGDKFWIAVRGVVDNAEHPLWKDLKARGYQIGTPLEFKARDANAYMVPVTK